VRTRCDTACCLSAALPARTPHVARCRRPHKRRRATNLKGKCVEYIGDNLHAVFEADVLDVKLREQILEYLCENPVLVELPDGEWPALGGRGRGRGRARARARAPASATAPAVCTWLGAAALALGAWDLITAAARADAPAARHAAPA